MQSRILLRYTPPAMNTRPNSFFRRSVLFCAAAFLVAFVSVFAQEGARSPSRAAAALDTMPGAKKIDEVALSPDGSRVAYIADGKLAVVPVAGGPSQSIAVEGNLALRGVAWSADSKHLAFIADLAGDVPAAQLWTAKADGSSPVKHAELKGYVQ